jgi:undecaprenyl-diphosphatase
MTMLHAILLGIVEGLTEFFPISSTGHLIVVERIFQIHNPSIVFNTVIQLGAITAVCLYYWKHLHTLIQKTFQKDGWIIPFRFFVATLPVLIFGFLLHDLIVKLHESTLVVAGTSILVAFYMIWVERKNKDSLHSKKEATTRDYFMMGLFQTLSIIPGVSRSGITILGSNDKPNACEWKQICIKHCGVF